MQPKCPCREGLQAGEAAQQCRFAHAIGAEHAQHLSTFERKVQICKNLPSASVSEARIRDLKHQAYPNRLRRSNRANTGAPTEGHEAFPHLTAHTLDRQRGIVDLMSVSCSEGVTRLVMCQ
jgi:hypothetical protein